MHSRFCFSEGVSCKSVIFAPTAGGKHGATENLQARLRESFVFWGRALPRKRHLASQEMEMEVATCHAL